MNNELKVETGNAYKDANERNWLVGSFINDSSMRKDDDVEVKFVRHQAGEEQINWTKNTKAKSLCILVRGKVLVTFEQGEYVMEKEGDYVMWAADVAHTWKILEDSLVVTVKWPSAPGSEVEVSF